MDNEIKLNNILATLEHKAKIEEIELDPELNMSAIGSSSAGALDCCGDYTEQRQQNQK
ncbi:hypothetical protein [Vibrio hyugaensis]|uniref:hypothetical protein n=1 Tax=Vibrio hyugaensis TaxID=1534743 RepID=UPI000A92E6A4|nr:hypothetical protein [Vibrio hyugaensis]